MDTQDPHTLLLSVTRVFPENRFTATETHDFSEARVENLEVGTCERHQDCGIVNAPTMGETKAQRLPRAAEAPLATCDQMVPNIADEIVRRFFSAWFLVVLNP